ncbi:hypothetical protein AMTRI_Chr07g30320 [Amborella trichopoda]
MQRYTAASCGGGVSNSAVGGGSARDSTRADSSFSPNFSLNPRRSLQLTPYKLKCDKEPLSSRLGPPDFYPQTPNCPEETLTKEVLQSGYRETIDGIEEAREITLTQIGTLSKPVIVRCKEAIRKRLRAINESRAQKRKAGQVYGVPLSGPLLIKSGVFPEQRPSGEDFRKKWIEGLSQQHKRLRSLADHVPHGYRKRSLFEVLIRHNVPLLRATWFIKVNYLNQVRPVPSGGPDKTQSNRTELWTKDVIDYLQHLLYEFLHNEGSHSVPHSRDHSPQTQLLGTGQHHGGDSIQVISDGEEPALQFKWWYMVQIIQWHYAEGLLLPSQIIEWVLSQLQENESLEVLKLLLPIVYNLIESIALCQSYVRMLVDISLRSLEELATWVSNPVDNSLRSYVASSLAELLQYLILNVPDTFVALDSFPLPSCVFPDSKNASALVTISPDVRKGQSGSTENFNKGTKKGRFVSGRQLAFRHVVSAIQIRAAHLTKAVSPGLQGHLEAKLVQSLDKTLILGDVRGAHNSVFEDVCDADAAEGWISEVSPNLQSCLKWIGIVSQSLIYSVFFLCEWATCDFRDFHTPPSSDVKVTGRKDISQVYMAVSLLKLKKEEICISLLNKDRSSPGASVPGKGSLLDKPLGNAALENPSMIKGSSRKSYGSTDSSDIFQSPGPLHEIVVSWLDQHDTGKGEGFKRLQVLIIELIRCGIFYPQAYVRQLIVSGLMDKVDTPADVDRRKRHIRILKQLPGHHLFDALEGTRVAEVLVSPEAVHQYSNERRLVLQGFMSHSRNENDGSLNFASQMQKDHHLNIGKDVFLSSSFDQRQNSQAVHSPLSGKSTIIKVRVAELKASISVLLQLPDLRHASKDKLYPSQGNLKRPASSPGSCLEMGEGTPGCEECRKTKRHKLSDERSSYLQGYLSIPSDDEDTWWMKKGPKPLELAKIEQPVKPIKHTSRGRQRIVRKTQSLAHLGATRIESSQGASSSHVCENKINCPHHRSSLEGENPKIRNGLKAMRTGDIIALGKALKQLRVVEKWSITIWLRSMIKQLVEGREKANTNMGQSFGPFSPASDDKNAVRWKLGEDSLSSILYLLDVSSDLYSAVKILLWLLPKASSGPNLPVHSGRNISVLPGNKDGDSCEVGEAFLLSCLQRYENILIAVDLLPELLSAAMHRAMVAMTSHGRVSISAAFNYARVLLQRYGSVASVIKWEKNFKATCDQRLLAELESGRSLDSDLGFTLSGLPSGSEDFDDYFRQKISAGRLSRAGPSMKEIVQRHIGEAAHYIVGKERKLTALAPRSFTIEKWDEEYQSAHHIVSGVIDCIRQNGAGAQQVEVAAAVSAIVGNVGNATNNILELASSATYSGSASTLSSFSLNCARRIIQMHTCCLCLLKDALGERHTRAFEIALATEASSTIAGAFSPGKVPRSQFQLSPETSDTNSNLPNELMSSSAKIILGRPTKAAAAASALVIDSIIHGITNLERMLTVLKLKEGLDFIQVIRGTRSCSNGLPRSMGNYKADNSMEVSVHWFRLLAGNCRTVFDGLVAEFLGETAILAFSRLQRMLPLNLVFPPAYSVFAMVIWRPIIMNSHTATREDIQLYQSLSSAIGDVIRHQPFRDTCLRDTHALYVLLASDSCDSEFASMLEVQNIDKHVRIMAFVPLRARMFLNAVLDCRMPTNPLQDDGVWAHGHGESKVSTESELKLQNQLVHVLDTLQPAKFHWQWVELRLLLNEQVLIEKVDGHGISLTEALRSLLPNADNGELSEKEKTFTEIILTRLLVRPDAATLYSETVHLLGKSLEELLLLHAKWVLEGPEVLLGRKSLRHKLKNLAQTKGLSTKTQSCKPWGWSTSMLDATAKENDKRRLEATSLEEGEVVDDGLDTKKTGKQPFQGLEMDGFNSGQQFVTEKALADLVLPCLDRSSNDSRNTFASDLIKQLNNIEQQISLFTRVSGKQAAAAASGGEGSGNKGGARKGIRGGSPGLARRITGASESAPPSPSALQASMWLRLQLLLRLLPIIYADRDPSNRNMRHILTSVLLRLLGSRVVHEDSDLPFAPLPKYPQSKREPDSSLEAPLGASSFGLSGDSLFDRFLCVLHGLLSSYRPSWLKTKCSKLSAKSSRDFIPFDRELVERMQVELDHMQLPPTIRLRLQAAMPILPPTQPFSFSSQPPSPSITTLHSLHIGTPNPTFSPSALTPPPKAPVPSIRASTTSKSKPISQLDPDLEIDPWTLLEDGTGSASGSGSGSGSSSAGVGVDQANLKACPWLKGAVRVRRTDLTYVGTLDDDT